MTKRPREWLKFGGLLAVTLLIGAAFIGVANDRAAGALQRTAGIPELSDAAMVAPAPVVPGVQPAADLSAAFAATAQVVRPAVVYIQAESRAQERSVPPGFERLFPQPDRQPRLRRGEGSGFVITADGYILTNNHVVEDAERLRVRLLDRREFDAEVVGRDPATDVAVIKINAQNLPHVAIGNSDSVRIGEWVLAVGNPLGQEFSFTVTAGIISAKGRALTGLQRSEYSIMDFLQTDAVINPGNSGGPLVNLSGQVIGINSAIASESGYYQGYGFAIPMNLARTVADQLIRTGQVTRAVLGVGIDEVTPLDAEAVGVGEIAGVVVNSFSMDDSPAQRAGIEIGDVIVALNGEPVRYIAQLQQRVGFMQPGEEVEVTYVRRGGERRTARVRLAAAPTVTQQVASRTTPVPDATTDNAQNSKLGLTLRPVAPNTTIGNIVVSEETAGLAVVRFEPSGPADGHVIPFGARGGPDIITHVNRERVRSLPEFDAALKAVAPGDVVTLRIWNPTAQRQRVERMRAQ